MEILTIIAIIIGPIAAVQAQKFLEKSREKKNSEEYVFRTLMATRGNRVVPLHVEALNLIDLVFRRKKQKSIIDAWNIYRDHLGDYPENSDEDKTWADRAQELLIDLLYEISKYLKYDFDKVQLKRGIYVPRAHGWQETENLLIRKGLVEIFKGEMPIHVKVDV